MKAVLDTNVIVSGLISPPGPPGQLLEIWLDGRLDLVTSEALLAELERVVRRPRVTLRLPQNRALLVPAFRSRSEIVTPDLVLHVLADEPDNRVLEAALAGGADVIVTGDAALLALGDFRGVRVVAPAQFLAELEGR